MKHSVGHDFAEAQQQIVQPRMARKMCRKQSSGVARRGRVGADAKLYCVAPRAHHSQHTSCPDDTFADGPGDAHIA